MAGTVLTTVGSLCAHTVFSNPTSARRDCRRLSNGSGLRPKAFRYRLRSDGRHLEFLGVCGASEGVVASTSTTEQETVTSTKDTEVQAISSPSTPEQGPVLDSTACQACGKQEKERGCNGEGRIQGGIGAVPGFGWWPIKAYRPCPSFVQAGGRYRRQGQSLEEVAFGRQGKQDNVDISERLKGD